MSFLLSLFLVSLSFESVFCEKCSEALRKTFNKSLHLTDRCDDCKVLPRIFSRGTNWAGFCAKNQFFMFQNWQCRPENELERAGSFVVVTERGCEHSEESSELDVVCLRVFNAEMCNGESELKSLADDSEEEGGLVGKGFLNLSDVNGGGEFTAGFLTDESTSKPFLGRVLEKRAAPTKPTGVIQTFPKTFSPHSNEVSSTSPTSPTSTTSITWTPCTTSTATSTKSTPVDKPTSPPMFRHNCEMNEVFYKGYCYFIKKYWEPTEEERNTPRNASFNIDRHIIDSTQSCQDRHPRALGLAVKTEEENKFITDLLSRVHFYERNIIFTSGVQINASWGEWIGWKLQVNRSVLNMNESLPIISHGIYCINCCPYFWYVLDPHKLETDIPTLFIVCKRPYNPKKVKSDLHEYCLQLYRKSPCYRLNKFVNFCCAKDDQGEIWFGCPNRTSIKNYSNTLECQWNCGRDGFFYTDKPTCTGKYFCKARYNTIEYIAPVQRYAISGCPKPYSGNSSWYCASNRTFIGTPDYSLCCGNRCVDTDMFLNVWMGCPSKTVKKRTECPPGTLKREADVEWYCQERGTFLGAAPNYTNCNESGVVCSKTDRFGTEWVGGAGTTVKKKCPESFSGDCTWKCKSDGKFEGPEPDCSKCKAVWMDEIADKIKNDSQHEEVMTIMENYTTQQDLRMGFSHVINLTSDCVTLYKRQNDKNEFNVFDKFLKSYSKILRNLAGNSTVWSSFAESTREEHVGQIVQTTQHAAFANLESRSTYKGSKTQYNVTLTTTGVEGFDFFVAYNPPRDIGFPLQNFSQSDWQLKISKMKEDSDTFAAMGLIMNTSLSSLMFPRGNETNQLEMNAPAVTFTVASATNGEVVIDPNVTVVISFKHANETRFPAAEVIRRKLHVGEHPSGVVNSTLCFYYRDSDWSTEGCSVTFSSKYRTNCTCNHLSTIGLLMSVHKYKPNQTLECVSTVCSGITIISLILTLLVFYFVDKTNNDRVLIGKNLCLCLLIGHTMLFSVMDKRFFNTSDTVCRVYAILLHYVFMAAFAWMFVEGCHLYRMLVVVFDSDTDYRYIYCMVGYGVPFVIVGATELAGFIFQEQPYGQDELCWLKPPNYVWAFIGPATTTSAINFCILLVAMKLAISSKRRAEKSNFGALKLWLKGWISLSTLLGITWLFGLGYIRYNETFVYTFVVFNGLQGFFIFLFRCVLCEQYKTAILKKVKSWFSRSRENDRRKSENIKSETKVCAVSVTKSSSGVTESKDSGFETDVHKPNRCPTKQKGKVQKENPAGLGIDINVALTPAMSEAYLRNRMIARNFSARKSKARWLADSDNFPEP